MSCYTRKCFTEVQTVQVKFIWIGSKEWGTCHKWVDALEMSVVHISSLLAKAEQPVYSCSRPHSTEAHCNQTGGRCVCGSSYMHTVNLTRWESLNECKKYSEPVWVCRENFSSPCSVSNVWIWIFCTWKIIHVFLKSLKIHIEYGGVHYVWHESNTDFKQEYLLLLAKNKIRSSQVI